MIKLFYPRFWSSRGVLAYILLPISLVYILLTKLRAIFSKKIKFPAKVICVGNITVGGTGKTQLVGLIARYLTEHSKTFIIITKAYKSKVKSAILVKHHHNAHEVGDESIILRKFGNVIAAKSIKYAYEMLKTMKKPDYIIMDDGMQNPSVHKDIIFITIDGSRLFGNEFIFPAGPMRQTLKSCVKKINGVILFDSDNSYKYNQGYHDSNLFLQNAYHATVISKTAIDKTKNYIAFAGIGNPNNFFSMLERYSICLIEKIAFEDHHDYSYKEFTSLVNKAESLNAILITTEKDFVKLEHFDIKCIVKCVKVDIVLDRQINII